MTKRNGKTDSPNFIEKMVHDMGATASAALVILGHKLGLYGALAKDGPMSSEGLAERTRTNERYVREWLAAQAAAGYVEYDTATERFSMNDDQVAVFADAESPVFMAGGFQCLASLFIDEPKITKAFKTGEGVGWGEHSECLFCGTEEFFRPAYNAHLILEWIPALDGVNAKLHRGAKVADVGCGHGVSTFLMAKAFPKSTFVGIDFHEPSIERARTLAKEGDAGNVTFEVAAAKTFPGKDYDLVTVFDCLHDMGDPVGAASHIRRSLDPDGTWMVVEPFAHDRLEDNLNPIGRLFYSFSTMICTPASVSQEVGLALGGQAGEARLRDVAASGGFTRFRRATETAFYMVLEARP